MIGDSKYCARAGYPEEAYTYKFIGKTFDDSINKKDNSDVVKIQFVEHLPINTTGLLLDSQQPLKLFIALRPADVGAVIDRPRATNSRPYIFLSKDFSVLQQPHFV